MPRRATNSDQCVYSEGNRRCRRTGTGDPPVCNAHKIAYVEAARKATSRRPGDAIYNLFDTFLSGKKVTRKKIKNAWDDLGDIIGDPNVRSKFTPPNGWQPPPGWTQRQAPTGQPPPEDPRVAEARREFLLAKRVMGFAESEPITADQVKDRRKELARRYHPDRPGGSVDKMQQINAAADVLLRAA